MPPNKPMHPTAFDARDRDFFEALLCSAFVTADAQGVGQCIIVNHLLALIVLTQNLAYNLARNSELLIL